MRNQAHLLALLLLVSSVMRLHAEGGPPPWAGPNRQPATAAPSQGERELGSLEQFLSLSDEQLDALIEAVRRVRAMTPEQRAAFKRQIMDYRNLPTKEKDRIHAGWGWQTEEDRQDWPLMMRDRTQTQRTAIQAELQRMPQERRAAWKHERLEAWRRERDTVSRPER